MSKVDNCGYSLSWEKTKPHGYTIFLFAHALVCSRAFKHVGSYNAKAYLRFPKFWFLGFANVIRRYNNNSWKHLTSHVVAMNFKVIIKRRHNTLCCIMNEHNIKLRDSHSHWYLDTGITFLFCFSFQSEFFLNHNTINYICWLLNTKWSTYFKHKIQHLLKRRLFDVRS